MIQAQRGERLEINMTPLLDLVLQLIMFFMLTVNFVRIDQANAGVDLPVVQSAMPSLSSGDNHVYITIGKDGQRRAGDAVLRTEEELRRFINVRREEVQRLARQRELTGPADIIVVVRADKDVSWGVVWDTLDECIRAGCRGWQLRVIKQSA